MTTDVAPRSTTPVVDAPIATRPLARVIAVGLFVVVLGTMVAMRGWPQDYFSVFAWLWLLAIAWNVEARPVSHLAFVRDWWIPLALLILYFYSREIADNLGIATHIQYPIDMDVWIGAGDTPTARLQGVLCGTPCDPTAAAHWYDRFFIVVWMSHFTVGLTVAVIFWLRNRREFLRWMSRYLTINFAALVCYVLVPTAPPWMASMQDRLPTEIYRLGSKAWVGPRPEGVVGGADPASWAGNQVAAMPSLHTGVAVLIALYGIQRLSTPWRWALLLYPLSMATALVYLGEHYVADVIGGVVLAIAVQLGVGRWERARDRRRLAAAQDALPEPTGVVT